MDVVALAVEVFTNQQQKGGGGQWSSFHARLAVLRWPMCSEWIMSVHLCEAVPCPPARRGTRWGLGEYEWL